MEHRHSVPPPRFVPSGVDAQTWLGFEQRIQERRYKALLDTIKASVARRDGMAARAALEEARELRPAAPELAQLSARVALLPTVMPEAASASHLWQRPLGAAAMLIVGVGLVAGLESMRSTATEAPVTTAAVRAATAAPAPPVSAAPVTVDAAAPPAAPSTPAVEPLEPARAAIESRGEEPVGTTGLRRTSIADERAADVPNRRTFRPAVDIEPIVPPSREVSDDYVAPRARSESGGGVAEAPAPAPGSSIAANVVRQPVPITQPAATIAAASIARPDSSTRVTQVLNQYARAYDQLDTSAARAVWPTVDERALARAFAGLQSQDVDFDNCSIDVKGVTASASCRGRASYVGKVGNGDTRTEPREWNFELTLQGDDWKIAKADTKRR